MPTPQAHTPIEVEIDLVRAQRFYTRLRRRLSNWLVTRGRFGGQVADVLLVLPDLFALVLRLMQDPRVGRSTRLELAAAAIYVISPVDLIPDFFFPFGYIDDAVALALVLSRAAKLMGETGEEILQEHWEGKTNVLHAITTVTAVADQVLNRRILRQLRRRFGGGETGEAECHGRSSTTAGSDD